MIDLDIESAEALIGKKELDGVTEEAGKHLETILTGECRGSEMLGWLRVGETSGHQLEAIRAAGAKIREAGGCLVVIGIGGSYLGARAAIETLRTEASFPVLFAGNNLSPEYHFRLLHEIEDRDFSLCVISKSGTTTEPAIAFRLLRKELRKRYGKEEADRRTVIVTDAEKGALRKTADAEGLTSFTIPRDVGGRFSVLTPVGLVPCAASGIPVDKIMEGAAEAFNSYTVTEADNPVLRYAAARFALYRRGAAAEVLSTFHPELATFSEWWKQLAGESEGKKGKGLFPVSAVMTTDLHSLGQLLQEGTRDIFETILSVSRPARDISVPEDDEGLDGLDYLEGWKVSDINAKALEGTREAHISGGIPVNTITVPCLTPEVLGEVFVFFELSIAVSGLLLGVNPFDQPGVDEYKTRMFRLLGKPGY